MRRLTPIGSTVILLLCAFFAHAHSDTVIKEYRGVFMGTDRAQVHEKLGKPKDESPVEDDFEFSEGESARVFYDNSKKVKAIVITYAGKPDKAPKPRDVIGEPIEPKPDGGMYKMVRFEEKGFWVSYVRTAGENASVMITVQAIVQPG
ncbi:MAG: hypothetical protein ABIR33_12485 [Pyrinomonadaceae bacterium]